jgi:CRP/FNR family cyclic AMP-dependent transcriptional regulator
MSVSRRNLQTERLRDIEIFSACTKKELKRIDSLTTNLRAKSGRVLTREGGRGLQFIIVLHGTATASRQGMPIGRLGPGSSFGGSALLDRGEQTASVIAETDMELLVSSLNEFWTLYRAIPAVSREMNSAWANPLQMADIKECAPGGVRIRKARRANEGGAAEADCVGRSYGS